MRGPATTRRPDLLEGHRPHPEAKAPRYASGAPPRPKGMPAAARRVWDGYVAQLAGSLRLVDGFALRRLCEDVALLEELQAGMRKIASELKRKAKAEGRELPGGAMIQIAKSQDGRRLSVTIGSLSGRIARQEMQFGLTPASAPRIDGFGIPMVAEDQSIELALCG